MSAITSSSKPTRIGTMTRAEFAERFGYPDVRGALCGYTREDDTRVVLPVLVHAQPRNVLEIGTALGHMTANLTRWTGDDARVFTIDPVRGMSSVAPGAVEQQVEVPSHEDWSRFANHFGTAHKAFFITADAMTYDFGRIAPMDFAFIDGVHDLAHVLNDSGKLYEALAAGGWMVWHDFNSPVPWVQVRAAIERAGFTEPVVHIEGTEVAFLRKGEASPGTGGAGTFSEGSGVRVAGAEPATPQDNGLGSRAPACLAGPHGAARALLWRRSAPRTSLTATQTLTARSACPRFGQGLLTRPTRATAGLPVPGRRRVPWRPHPPQPRRAGRRAKRPGRGPAALEDGSRRVPG